MAEFASTGRLLRAFLAVFAIAVLTSPAEATQVTFRGQQTGSRFDFQLYDAWRDGRWGELSETLAPSGQLEAPGRPYDSSLAEYGLSYYSDWYGSGEGFSGDLINVSFEFTEQVIPSEFGCCDYQYAQSVTRQISGSYTPFYVIQDGSLTLAVAGSFDLPPVSDMTTEEGRFAAFTTMGNHNQIFQAGFQYRSAITTRDWTMPIEEWCGNFPNSGNSDCIHRGYEASWTELNKHDGMEIYRSFSEDMKIESVNGVAVTPIPEPETYAMLLAGLGLLGVVARRRKQQG